MDTRTNNLIDRLLGQGWGYSEFKAHFEEHHYTWNPGLKRVILGRDLEFFRQEIEERRVEDDIDEGARSQSNSLSSIRERLQGKPWLQSQPTLNELDQRRRDRRLLGRDVKIRSLQNYVKRWDLEEAAAQNASTAADYQTNASTSHPHESLWASSVPYNPTSLSPRPAISQMHGAVVIGDKRNSPSVPNTTESAGLHNNLPSTIPHDARNLCSNRMSFIFDDSPGGLVPEPATSSFNGTGGAIYSDSFGYSIETFSYSDSETPARNLRELSAGYFDHNDDETQSNPDNMFLLDDQQLAPTPPDHSGYAVLTQRPERVSSNQTEADLGWKIEHGILDPSHRIPARVTTQRLLLAQHRLTETFGNADMAYDLQNEQSNLQSDIDMGERSFPLNDDDDERPGSDQLQPEIRSIQLSEATSMIGPNAHPEKEKVRRCCAAYRAKIKALRRQREEVQRAHEAEVSKFRESELVTRKEAEQAAAKIQELQKIMQKLDISRQETASMTYDQLTLELIAKKIVEEETLKSQNPLHSRRSSNTSSVQERKGKILRTFAPSTSPLPLRTAKNAHADAIANRGNYHTPDIVQALDGDGHSRSNSSMNRFLQKFGKPNSQKFVNEASLSKIPVSPQSIYPKDTQATSGLSLVIEPIPRIRHVAQEDAYKRLTGDSGYQSLRSVDSEGRHDY